MVIEFSVKNFRSIGEMQTLSFATTGLKSSREHTHVDSDNITIQGNEHCFNTIGIYGANASGKSNIVKALDYFVKIATSQPSSVSNLDILTQPFLFQKEVEVSESFFQIVLILNDIKYRYGLTVMKKTESANSSGEHQGEIITSEWLYSNQSKNMSPLFIREGKKIIKNGLQGKNKVPTEIPYEHTLFLTHVAAFDTDSAPKMLLDYLRGYIVSDYEIKHDKFRWMSIRQISDLDESKKSRLRNLLSAFNLKYDDIILDEEQVIDFKKIFPQDKISFLKNYTIGDYRDQVNLNLKFHESSGTQKMFDLAGLLLVAFNLSKPAFIILDEIDSNFHPSLLIKLIGLFNNPTVNISRSQLLFTSHDTNLMSPAIMRRDQFYFTEKKLDNSTRLYSLSDLKGIRNDADFSKQYLAGYYGGLPVLETFTNTLEQESDGE